MKYSMTLNINVFLLFLNFYSFFSKHTFNKIYNLNVQCMSTKKRRKYNSRQTIILLLYNARDLQKMLKEKNFRFSKSWHYVYKGYVVTRLPEGKKKEK